MARLLSIACDLAAKEIGDERPKACLSEPIGGTLDVLGATYPRYRLVLIGISVVVLGGLVLWYAKSRTGTSAVKCAGSKPLAGRR